MTRTEPAATALAAVDMAREDRFDDIVKLFAPNLREMVPAATMRASWAVEIANNGPVSSVGTPVTEPAGPGTSTVRIPVTYERGTLTLVTTVTDDGWIAGIQLAPAGAAEPVAPWQPPPYADPARFDEHDVTVGADPLAVPGTLSVPRGPAPLPAVVLLAGSGPQDGDETIGRNKPLKDLAWGLASSGVAVLRFDKVTYAHGHEVAKDRGFTVADEYVPHAVAAIHLLNQHPAVDPRRVFVAGHSLGGTVAPRVAAAEASVAGLVILAGGTQPLHWATVRQFRYLAELNPEVAAASRQLVETVTRQATLIDSADLSPATPAGDLLFGVPAEYWLDLRDYDPAAAAAALRRPILVVQGGRDYQVTVADDLVRWRASLDHRPDVTIRVYDADNHLFFPGTGPSTPAEYEPAQHMDPAVVADVAGWLTAAANR